MLTKVYSIILISVLFWMSSVPAQEYKNKLVQKFQNEIVAEDDLNIQTIETIIFSLLKNNHEIAAAFKEIDALQKAKQQQDLMPNPEFGIEAENFLGSKDFRGFRGSELTITLSQEILLAGKIDKRTKVAEHQSELAYYEYESKRLGLITNARLILNEICNANNRLLNQKELLQNSKEFLNDIKLRNEKGQISSLEVTRSSIIHERIKIEIQNTESKIEAAVSSLSYLLNAEIPVNSKYKEENIFDAELPIIEKLIIAADDNPDIAKQKIVEMRDQSKIEFEESMAVPDLTIGVGIRRFNETDDNALVFGISLPVPIYNNNEASIAESIIRKDINRSILLSKKNDILTELTNHYRNAQNIRKNLSVYKTGLIPNSQDALTRVEEGNRVGRFGILDVLDLQRTLFELEMEYMDLLKEYKTEIIKIENLIAQSLSSVN